MNKTAIQWRDDDGISQAVVGDYLLSVAQQAENEYDVTIDVTGNLVCVYDKPFVGSLDRAKRSAVAEYERYDK